MQRLAPKQTRRGKNQKTGRLVAQAALGCAAVAAAGLSPGCNLVNPPQPEPVPTAVPTPKPDIFDPADGVTALVPLNGPSTPGNALPTKFRVVNILSGELIQLQSLSGTAPNWVPGTSDVYRMAGIVTVAPGQPGYAETVAFIAARTLGAGKEVDVEQDPRFPQDLDGRRMVQVFYARATSAGPEKVLLNRMMVRQGFAVVDINAPTSVDVRAWLNDEEYARKKGLGLNRLGITIAQRIPVPLGGTAVATAAANPGGVTGAAPSAAMGAPASTTTTTTTTSTVVGAPSVSDSGASNAAGSMAPAASNAAP